MRKAVSFLALSFLCGVPAEAGDPTICRWTYLPPTIDGKGDDSGDGSTDGGFGSSIDGAKTNVGGGGDEAVERKNPFAALREWRAEKTA